MKKATNLFLYLILLVDILRAYGYLLKLPCGYQANFTLKYRDKYMEAKVVKLMEPINTLQDCVLNCVTYNKTCEGVNFAEQTKYCELLEFEDPTLVVRDGWIFHSYDTLAINNGATCQKLKPCIEFQRCFDTCDDVGYECKPNDIENVAIGKEATISSVAHNQPGSNCIDNDLTTKCHTHPQINPWLRVDLKSLYRIHFIRITGRPNFLHRVNNFKILIEHKSKKVFALTSQTTLTKGYRNDDEVFYGNLVRLIHIDQKNNHYVNMAEIEIFGKPAIYDF